jgi:hypothetical protein
MARGGRPRDGAPTWVSSGPGGGLARRSCGKRRRVAVAGRPPCWTRQGPCRGPHRGLRAGPGAIGVTRERGSAPCFLATVPAWDTGPHGARERPMGAPWSAPTVTPTRPRMAAQAVRAPARVGTPLAHRRDDDVWREAAAAPRDENRRARPARRRRGRSQAAPVERVWGEKEDGRQRPRGPPACAATMVQRAVAMRLEARAAPACLDGAAGVRPGRRPPAARHAVRERGMTEGRGAVESLDRTRLRAGRRQRGKAGRLGRLLGTGRRASVMAHGRAHPPCDRRRARRGHRTRTGHDRPPAWAGGLVRARGRAPRAGTQRPDPCCGGRGQGRRAGSGRAEEHGPMTTAGGPRWPAPSSNDAAGGWVQHASSPPGRGAGERPRRVARLHP